MAIKKIPMDKVKPGDELGKDMRSSEGNLILGKGSALTSALISRLQGMGFRDLMIDDHIPVTDEEINARMAEVELRFAGQEKNRLMIDLKRIVKNQVRKDLTGV